MLSDLSFGTFLLFSSISRTCLGLILIITIWTHVADFGKHLRRHWSVCRRGFARLMLRRAVGRRRGWMWKAMTYEVRPAGSKKNTSKPSRCATCGPLVKAIFLFFFFLHHGHSAAERVDFQMCLKALTYVREGVCKVGANGGWLLSRFKEVQMSISVSAHWAYCRLGVEASSLFFYSFLWFVRLG